MKRILFLLLTFITLFIQNHAANAEPDKVIALKFDTASSLVHITLKNNQLDNNKKLVLKKLENPERVYFDIEDAVLIGEKKHIVLEKSPIKEIRLSQFSTQPDVVRAVITLEENFDMSKIKLFRLDNNIFVKIKQPILGNNYFNPIYDETPEENGYSSIVANEQVLEKIDVAEIQNEFRPPASVMEDIQQAFGDTSLNSSGETKSIVSLDISSNLKLRTKYYINGYYLKNGGLLVSGLGQITAEKMFYLDEPKRVVIDLPNAFLDKNIRNQELKLCPDGTCKDIAKIGQFEYNKARIVITSNDA